MAQPLPSVGALPGYMVMAITETSTLIKMQIYKLEPEKATFSDAMDMARIIVRSFEKDQMFKVWVGPLYSPPLPSRSKYYYNKLILSQALSWWQTIKSNSKCTWILCGENKKMVGFCTWAAPASMAVAQSQSWWVRFKNWIRSKIGSMFDIILAIGDGNQSLSARLKRLSLLNADLDNEIGWLKVDRSKLAHLNQDELSKTLYHKEDIWWCTAMAILPEHQGKGLGYRLFNHTLENLEPFYPVFKDGKLATTGPAKFGLCSTEPGRKLYEKCGFTLHKNYAMEFEGEELPWPAYFKTSI